MSVLNLPEKLELDGTPDEIFSMLYDVFKKDLISHRLCYRGCPVIFDNRKINSVYEEGFWHIITRGRDQRVLDYRRAKRICWIRPIIQSSPHKEILYWIEEDNDKKGKRVQKHYFWYEKGRYIIILKQIPNKTKYFLLTAFYITGDRNNTYYKKKYQNAQKKGPGY